MTTSKKHIKLTRRSTSALIAESLRERLMNHEFAELEMLRQDHLAKEYNVSLSPVREALIQLEAEGLVTAAGHRGYSVAALSIDDLQQFYELRALLEAELLKYAIPKLQESDLALARKAHQAMEKIYDRGTQTTAWTTLNWEFHTSLYKPAQKKQMLSVVENVYSNINRYVHMQLKIRSSVDLKRNIEEHAALIRYCEAHDTNKAAQLLRRHVMQAGDDLIGFLQQNK